MKAYKARGPSPITLRGQWFARCHECDNFRRMDKLIPVDVYDDPWQAEPSLIWVCGDEKYSPSQWGTECYDLLTDTSWADFRYFHCSACERMVISQCPSNGWHSYVRVVYECEEWCLRCYQEELEENGLNEIGRDSLEAGQLPGMFLCDDDLLDTGWEKLVDNTFINSGESAAELAQRALDLMDGGNKVIIGYERLGIGGGEGFVSLFTKPL